MRERIWIASSASLLVAACFNPGTGSTGTDSGSSGSADSSSGAIASITADSGTGQISAEGTSATTMTDPTTGDPTTASPDSSTGPDEPGTSTGPGTGTGDESSTGSTVCPPVGPGGLPGVNPPSIWISNSNESTVSKIDTVSMIELARYATRPDLAGNPSRTSVSLDGDMAVANRAGGLTKIYGDPADCIDQDGDGVITTSSGGLDVLPWDQEECRAWHLPLVYTSQRPVAWTTGVLDERACEHTGERVWTSGVIDGTTIEVLRVDGETGVIEDSVTIPEIMPNYYGLYGGAVDSEGNFWASQLGQGSLVRVDAVGLNYQIWPMPASGYGMTVGASGYVFTCSNIVARFDPATETWQTNTVGGSGGCMEDGNGLLWMANDPLVAVDVNTLVVAQSIDLPNYVHGVSVDFAGLVWGAAIYNDQAYRVDPMTGTIDTVTGLDFPYTYSDMTGFALAAVTP